MSLSSIPKWLAALVFIGAQILVRAAAAESAYEREFRQLEEQRDREIATETQRINRVYRAALEKLLLRATQNRDYEASSKISEELRKLTEVAVPTMAAPSAIAAEGPLAERIEKLLTSTVWLHNGQYHYKFFKEGTVSLKEQHPKGHYRINGETGIVNFVWDGNQYPGEGLRFDASAGTFTPLNGGTFAPAPH